MNGQDTDGSKTQDKTEACLYRKHSFPNMLLMAHCMSNFDAEIFAILLALENLKKKINRFANLC